MDTNASQALDALNVLNGALLKAGDLGTGFAETQYYGPDPENREALLPCGQVATAAMFPNALRTGTNLLWEGNAQMEQSVALFLDEDTADQAYEYGLQGLNCEEGDVGGAAVGITDGGDVTSRVGGDKAHAWAATIGDESGVLIAVKLHRISLNFTYVIGAGVPMNTLPDPIDGAAIAVKKLIEAGF